MRRRFKVFMTKDFDLYIRRDFWASSLYEAELMANKLYGSFGWAIDDIIYDCEDVD